MADGYIVPRVPVSVGALIFDSRGRLLILKPTYKSGWTIPGGQMNSDGESPWEACRRETREECGLTVTAGRLVCMDFRPPHASRLGGVRFLFDCGVVGDSELATISLQEEEIEDHRLAERADALELLRGPVRRRVEAALAVRETRGCAYLEDGVPVPGVI
jgi:ADP-ribose pyrophosphatase YjhB (NUDIX family)